MNSTLILLSSVSLHYVKERWFVQKFLEWDRWMDTVITESSFIWMLGWKIKKIFPMGRVRKQKYICAYFHRGRCYIFYHFFELSPSAQQPLYMCELLEQGTSMLVSPPSSHQIKSMHTDSKYQQVALFYKGEISSLTFLVFVSFPRN